MFERLKECLRASNLDFEKLRSTAEAKEDSQYCGRKWSSGNGKRRQHSLPWVPLLSTSKADSGLTSEFRRDRVLYTAYERLGPIEERISLVYVSSAAKH